MDFFVAQNVGMNLIQRRSKRCAFSAKNTFKFGHLMRGTLNFVVRNVEMIPCAIMVQEFAGCVKRSLICQEVI